MLFKEYCQMDIVEVISRKSESINESQLLLVYDAIKELKIGKPIQYITGKAYFYAHDFFVGPGVLIPRPETEELVQIVINEHQGKNIDIIDIGTGSGCIAISIKKKMPGFNVYAVDDSEHALNYAYKNALELDARITFFNDDITDPDSWKRLPEAGIIVCNPPYVPESDKYLMHPNVADHEPVEALFVPDSRPLMYYEALFGLADAYTFRPVYIYAEIHEKHGTELLYLAKSMKIEQAEIIKDINNKDRIFKGKLF